MTTQYACPVCGAKTVVEKTRVEQRVRRCSAGHRFETTETVTRIITRVEPTARARLAQLKWFGTLPRP